MNKFKTKEKAAFVNGIQKLIDKELTIYTVIELERVYLALLFEIKQKVYIKLSEVKGVYSLSFTPAQALALRTFCLLRCKHVDDYMRNRMLQIANAIHQYYA